MVLAFLCNSTFLYVVTNWRYLFSIVIGAIQALHTVAIWTFTFHKKSGCVRVIWKANFKPACEYGVLFITNATEIFKSPLTVFTQWI